MCSSRRAFRKSLRPPNSSLKSCTKWLPRKKLIYEASSLVKRDAMLFGENFSTAVILLGPTDPADENITFLRSTTDYSSIDTALTFQPI